MKKIDSIILKYLVYALPLILTLLIWGSLDDLEQLSLQKGVLGAFWDLLGWTLLIWLLLALYVSLKMVFIRKFRDLIIKKTIRINERDERESYITSEAAKFSFISTISVAILFLFLSVITITVANYPEEIREPGKNGYISVGLNFFPFSGELPAKRTQDDSLEIFTYSGLPFSSASAILILLIWPIISFKYSSFRLLKEE